MRIKETDTNYLGGQIRTYQLVENSKVYYELRHSKPRADRGSKFRVYSKSSAGLELKVKSRLIGSPSIKSSIQLSEKMEQLLKELSKGIGSFKWQSKAHHLGWPEDLVHVKVLRFECKRIDLAHEYLELIRQTHLKLQENIAV